MTKHFGPAHFKRDVPGLEAFAFAGETPANRGYFMEPIIVRHIAGSVIENLQAVPRPVGNGWNRSAED